MVATSCPPVLSSNTLNTTSLGLGDTNTILNPVVGATWPGYCTPPLGAFMHDAPALSPSPQFPIMANLGIESFSHTPDGSGLVLMDVFCYGFVCSVRRSYCPEIFVQMGYIENIKKKLYFGFKLNTFLSMYMSNKKAIWYGWEDSWKARWPNLIIEDPLRGHQKIL